VTLTIIHQQDAFSLIKRLVRPEFLAKQEEHDIALFGEAFSQ
jgi:hypothetical protein